MIRSGTLTQEQRILAPPTAGLAGRGVPLPMILDLGIAQYNARIYALRRKGHKIENRSYWVHPVGVDSWFKKEFGRERHSYFRLVLPKPHAGTSPVGSARAPHPPSSAAADRQLSLLGSVAHAD